MIQNINTELQWAFDLQQPTLIKKALVRSIWQRLHNGGQIILQKNIVNPKFVLMGSSKSKYGSIFVRTDKPFYFSGEIVTGSAYLYFFTRVFQAINYLRVKGYEKCSWTESEGNLTVGYNGKIEFFNHIALLHKFDGDLLPIGQFAFPFQFTLTKDLPASFSYLSGLNSCEAKIKYTVQAEVNSNKKKKNRIKNQQELVVLEPLKIQELCIKRDLVLQYDPCCCIKSGKISLKIVLAKNQYVTGEKASLQLDVDTSNCKRNFNLYFELVRNIYMRSSEGRRTNFQQTMIEQKIDRFTTNTKYQNLIENNQTIHMRLINKKGKERYKDLVPSTNGKIVSCNYFLEVKPILDWCSCCMDGRLTIPINIVTPINNSFKEQVDQPSNWDPQTFIISSLSYFPNSKIFVPSLNKTQTSSI